MLGKVRSQFKRFHAKHSVNHEGQFKKYDQSAVVEGTITIKDKEHQKQNIAELNRNMTNNLDKLEDIFDKEDVKERQELAGLFGEIAYNQIHYMDGTQEQKVIYHALVGGIMSELSHGDFLSGASGAMVNKMLMEKIKEVSHGDPAMMQWLSAAVGSAVSKVLIDNEIAGGSAAVSGTKNNDLESMDRNIAEDMAIDDPGVNVDFMTIIVTQSLNYSSPKFSSWRSGRYEKWDRCWNY